MPKNITFIWIGRLKKDFWQKAAAHYWQRLGNFFKLQEISLKQAPSSLGPAQSAKHESSRIMQKTAYQERIIALDRQGRSCSSKALAQKLQEWTFDEYRPCFVLGGAYGLDQELCSKAHFVLSLGPMTLPHELARIVLLEQLYRAACINVGHPYHH